MLDWYYLIALVDAICSYSLAGIQFSGTRGFRIALDEAFDSIAALLIRLIYIFCEIDSTLASFWYVIFIER